MALCLNLILKEQAAKLEEFEMTKQKRSKKEEQSVEEKTTLHGKRAGTVVVHHLPKHSGNFGQNVNGN